MRFYMAYFKALMLMLLISTIGCNQAKKNERPNFIIFIADDISWNDFGCYGNKDVQTPNIDRVAGQGIKFTNAYLTTSSCSPSRISIMTGRYPHNTGAAELHTEPTTDFPTIASELKDNGYYTGQAGKWHMGDKIKSGFNIIEESHEKNGDGGEEQWIGMLKNRDKSKPFFFWYAAYDAHRIWGPNEFTGTHNPGELTPPVTLVDGKDTRLDLAKYYDEIKRFDNYIGKVEEELKNQGVLENTFIIIMADNGRPFPRDKTRLYDSGIKTPFIIKWTGGLPEQNVVSNSLVSSVDIAPTILDIVDAKGVESFQGKSFKTILHHPESPFREYVFAEHNWHDYEAYERMVRSRDYLYVFNGRPHLANQGPLDAVNSLAFKDLLENRKSRLLTDAQSDVFLAPRPSEELFYCELDSLQLNNLTTNGAYDEVKMKFKSILEKWMAETADDMPNKLTGDWYARLPGIRLEEGRKVRGEMPGKATGAENINNKGAF